ncbi:hypothetical protein [Nocardia sp. NPDC058633]|uniref:hypothetical protein n=1 Tax=Nocardia sp. NPDC058633 TaxID=3346568 RepID=UPI0036611BCE
MIRTLMPSDSLRFALGAATVGIVASMATLAAPQASATVTSIATMPSFTLGTHPYGTTCTYVAHVTVDDITQPVFFYEEGQGPSGFAEVMPDPNGTAKANWTPSRTGITYIYAFQPGATHQVRQTVSVGTGINAGSACIAL